MLIGRVSWNAPWSLGTTNSSFALGPKKIGKNLIELAGGRNFRMPMEFWLAVSRRLSIN